jgi:uncharacterized protein
VDSMTGRPQGAQPYNLLLLGLSVVGIFALGLCITALAGLAATLIDAALFGWGPTLERIREVIQAAGAEQSNLGLRALFVLSTVIYGAIVVAILLFAHWRGGPAWRDLIAWRSPRVGLTDRWVWTIVIAATAYGIAASLLVDRIEDQTQLAFKLPPDRVAAAIIVFLAVVVAPVTEELLFRGWIYTGLRHRLSMWPTLLVSSAIFAFAHYEGTHIYALAVFPIGLGLGALRERTGTTKVPILFHAFYNLLAVALSFME